MIGLPGNVRIYLACGVTDMRKGFDTLAAQVQTMLSLDPHAHHSRCPRGAKTDRHRTGRGARPQRGTLGQSHRGGGGIIPGDRFYQPAWKSAEAYHRPVRKRRAGGSRHREQSFIITSEGAERAEVVARRPLGDRREIGRGDLLNNIIRNFAQQPEKAAALALIERAAGLRRGAAQAAQIVHQAAEARGGARESQSMLLERLMRHRIARALEERLPGLTAQLRRHGRALARVAHIGADMADRLARMVRRPFANRQVKAEFGHQLGPRGQNLPDHGKQQKQTRRQSR